MHALLRDVRFALRMLFKSPGYTLVAILTLALGIGANAAIFSAVNLVLLRPLPFTDADRLIMVLETKPEMERMAVPYFNYLDYDTAAVPSLDGLAAMGLHAMTLTGKGDPEKEQVQMQSHDFLPLLGVQPALGRNFLPEEDAPRGARAVILSHGLWTRRFAADPEVLGREITLDGNEWTVVGVMAAEHRTFYNAELFIPLGARADEASFTDRAARPEIYMFARMKPGVTIDRARADLRTIGDGLGQRYPEQVGNSRPLVLDMQEELRQDFRVQLLVLLGAVSCVLLIAAANVANLMLERAMARQREMGIRAALGAGRWRLIRQLLVEAGLLALAGGALGLLIALWSVDVMTAARPGHPTFNMLGPITVDANVLTYSLVIALATGLLFGLVPALFASRQDLGQALKHADHHVSAGGGHLRARNLLVIGEVALAMTLAIGATLAIRGLMQLQRIEPGFDPHNVLASAISLSPDRFDSPAKVRQFWTEVQRRVAAIPGVVSVSTSTGAPNYLGTYNVFYASGAARTPENSNTALIYRTDVGFIETLKIPLLAGRTFGPQDTVGSPPVVLINQHLAEKFFPGQDPIGQHLQDVLSKQASVEVIGVVGHIKHDGQGAPDRTPYQLYYAYQQLPMESQADMSLGQTMILVARTAGDPQELAAQLRSAVTGVDPLEPMWGITTLEAAMDVSLQPRRFAAALLAVFAALALVLAAIGLYAVMASNVARRTHELGVRMALGAQPRDLVALVVRQGMTLVGIGVALGLFGAWGLARLMTSLLTPEIGATDPPTYLGVTLFLVTVGLLATYIPARRATRIDPMVALRHE